MLHSHSHNLERADIVYGSLAPSQPTYPAFSIPLHHTEASNDHDGPSYEPDEDQRSNGQRSGMVSNEQLMDDGPSLKQLLSSIQNASTPALMRNTAPPGQYDMLPPPNSTHASWQALHDYAQSHASEHGYALSINTTAKNRSRIKLACVCYGQPKNTHKLTAETRVRKNRVSYKTGCKMWIEGKKQDDGMWLLRVGQQEHNHPGRASEGWALQRKRTWGVVGGRIGVGGVTAKEELARLGTAGSKDNEDQVDDEGEVGPQGGSAISLNRPNHSLERGGMVWKIVEEEMLRKGEPNQGRDRGVGRTVNVLQARLPGIQIFKRDVYNIRAQIKRVRKAAGAQANEAPHDRQDSNDDDAEAGGQEENVHPEPPCDPHRRMCHQPRLLQVRRRSEPTAAESSLSSQIDPSLTPQEDNIPRSLTLHIPSQVAEIEIHRLRRENAELRRLLNEKTNEVKQKNIEITGLRAQMDYIMDGIAG